MQIAILGTYPPTRCGIATFTADVEQALTEAGMNVRVLVVDPDTPQAATGVPTIDSPDANSYAAAAAWVNRSNIDLVLVQHEFGIHGGRDGSLLLEFTSRLRVPYVVTLHTVLSSFTESQAATLETLCTGAAAVTVFTATARRMVLEQELAPSHAITIVPHGAPIELYRSAGHALRSELGLADDAQVLSTFGLLSPGKGIETAISAMRRIVDGVPKAKYVIAGRTHPGVQRTGGEQYRADLQALVDSLGLEHHVCFVDRFLTVDEIAELLSVTRVFLTPYRNEDQIVSGALTFAVAAGCPVVSTPYRYGRDMLSDGGGLLVPFDDPEAFATAALTLLADGPARTRALEAATRASALLSWPAVGRTLQQVLSTAVDRVAGDRLLHQPPLPRLAPAPNHLLALLDDTSVIQHAAHHVPRLEEGYCVDDTGRLLPIAAQFAREEDPSHRWDSAVLRMLAYLRAAAKDGDGLMRNFMSWDRRWLDEPHDGDHVGRAIWGLGELLQLRCHSDEATDLLQQLLQRPVQHPWPRLVAYRALGVLAAADRMPLDSELQALHDQVRAWYPPRADTANWNWPEERVIYDAARVPEVMMRLGVQLDDQELVDRGLEHFTWLEQRCRFGDHYRFAGHLGLGPGQDIGRSGDEQPLEAAAMIDAAVAYFAITGDPWADAVAERAWAWFRGDNRLCTPLGTLDNGACRDGLTAHGVNFNCGAESTISFHRAARAMQRLRQHHTEPAHTCSHATTTTR